MKRHLDDFGIKSVEKLRTDEALMFDAIALFGQAYGDLSYDYEITGSRLSYDNIENPWEFGLSLRNYILYVRLNY